MGSSRFGDITNLGVSTSILNENAAVKSGSRFFAVVTLICVTRRQSTEGKGRRIRLRMVDRFRHHAGHGSFIRWLGQVLSKVSLHIPTWRKHLGRNNEAYGGL